mgnify:CR=1 FL=1
MRCVVQRVTEAAVRIDGEVVGQAGKGFLLLIGVEVGDKDEDLDYIASKVTNLRIFEDENGKMSRSAADIGGGLLVISNFTLYGSVRHGRRPEFLTAARPEKAKPYYEALVKELEKTLPVACGVFGADMRIDACNDGPVTLFFDTAQL